MKVLHTKVNGVDGIMELIKYEIMNKNRLGWIMSLASCSLFNYGSIMFIKYELFILFHLKIIGN